VLYLDEPTIGLDVVSQERVRQFLQRVNREREVTILLTTHDLDDVERLSSRLVVIDEGRIIHDGTLDEVKDQYVQFRTLVVDLVEPAPPLQIEHAEVVRVDGPRQWLRFHRDRVTAAELVAAVARSGNLRDLTIEEPDIEDVVTRIYTRDRATSTPDPREHVHPHEQPALPESIRAGSAGRSEEEADDGDDGVVR
jgi:ABC-2 type transport system ATP-binding protein